MKNILSIFIIVGNIFYFLFINVNAKSSKELIVGVAPNPMVSTTSVGGKGTADARELFQRVADELKKLHGYTLTLKIYQAPKFLLKAIQDKAVDFSAMNLAVFLYAKKIGLPIKSFIVPSATGKKNEKYCIYVHKKSGIKFIKQLKGKKFVIDYPVFLSKKDILPPHESYIYWIMIKKILANNGVNQPLNIFFKEFKVLPITYESAAYAVLFKKFDGCLEQASVVKSMLNYDKGFYELTPIGCVNVFAGAPLVYLKDINPEIPKLLKKLILSPPKTKAVNELIKEFKGLKPVIVEDKDYAVYFQWLKEAEKKGWFKEFDEIMKKNTKAK